MIPNILHTELSKADSTATPPASDGKAPKTSLSPEAKAYIIGIFLKKGHDTAALKAIEADLKSIITLANKSHIQIPEHIVKLLTNQNNVIENGLKNHDSIYDIAKNLLKLSMENLLENLEEEDSKNLAQDKKELLKHVYVKGISQENPLVDLEENLSRMLKLSTIIKLPTSAITLLKSHHEIVALEIEHLKLIESKFKEKASQPAAIAKEFKLPEEEKMSSAAAIPSPVSSPAKGPNSEFTEWFKESFATTEFDAERLKKWGLQPEDFQHVKAFVDEKGPEKQLVAKTWEKVHITRKYVEMFLGLRWLGGTLISHYFQKIGDKAPNCAIATTHLGTLMKGANYKYSDVKQMMVDKSGKPINIFQKDVVLIPINEHGNHWTFAYIDMKAKTINYYNSMGGENTSFLKKLHQWLSDEAKKNLQEFKPEEWKYVTIDGPKQHNGSDCGIFCCMAAQKISQGQPLDFTQQDIPYLRLKMMSDILKDSPIKYQ